MRLDERDQLIFLDRLKDMRRLKGGQAYPPQFIENHLRSSSMIRDAIVIGDESRAFVTALVEHRQRDRRPLCRNAKGWPTARLPNLSQLEPIRAEVARAIA